MKRSPRMLRILSWSPDANKLDLHIVFTPQWSTAVCRSPRDNAHCDLLRLLRSAHVVYIPYPPRRVAAPGILQLYAVVVFVLLGECCSTREYSMARRMIWTKGQSPDWISRTYFQPGYIGHQTGLAGRIAVQGEAPSSDQEWYRGDPRSRTP